MFPVQFVTESLQNETAHQLAKKGNDGLGSMEPHTCCFCGIILKSRFNIRKHIERLHCRSTKMFCDLCPKAFFVKDGISQHMEVHCKKAFVCKVCDYRTARLNHFKKHTRIHAAKIECKICKKNVTSLKDHLTLHRMKEKCSVCQKVILKRSMKDHLKLHIEKPHKCKACRDAFDSKEDLRR